MLMMATIDDERDAKKNTNNNSFVVACLSLFYMVWFGSIAI